MANQREAMQMLSDEMKGQPDVNDGKANRLSKSLAQYIEHSRNADTEKCSECPLYVDEGHCKFVQGQINPDGWCNLWGFSSLIEASTEDVKNESISVKPLRKLHGPNGPMYTY